MRWANHGHRTSTWPHFFYNPPASRRHLPTFHFSLSPVSTASRASRFYLPPSTSSELAAEGVTRLRTGFLCWRVDSLARHRPHSQPYFISRLAYPWACTIRLLKCLPHPPFVVRSPHTPRRLHLKRAN